LAPVAARFPYSRKTVHHCFGAWRLDGTWERVHVALRDRVLVRLKRNPQPSAAIVDSQSVKTEIVRHPPKPAPEEVMEVMRAWVREFDKEGLAIDTKKVLTGKSPRPFLAKRWIVERTFSWLSQNRKP
jgi:hypothetical protein